MEKASLDGALGRAVVLLIGALALNWVWLTCFGKPIVYCVLGDLFSSLYLAWGNMVLLILAAFVALKLFRGQIYPALGGVVVIIGIIELPDLVEHAFRLGGTCG